METLQKNKSWLLPILCMAILTPFTPYLDMAIARYFYEKGNGVEHFSTLPIYDFFYVYALIPGQITIILSTAALLLSYIVPRCRPWRNHAMFLVLTLAVGSGFVCHVLLKDHWGRPRPRQVIEFGGQQEFRPYYKPNFFHQPETSKSFPSGHATMGFYFFTFILLGKRFHNKALFYAGLVLTLTLGFALGLTRMAQGGHFLSDVLMATLIMWLSAITFDWIIYEENK